MGFKVIETEEELRSAFSAGLMWWKMTMMRSSTEKIQALA